MKKSTLMLCICLLLSVALGVGSTLAYLTDRDAETNVFTIGSVDIELEEDFEQGSTLIPGVEIEKKPVITNTGDNDAWVWLTFSVPSALDNFVQGTEQGSNENVIHWNPTGATTEGYVNQDRVDKAIEQGLLPEGTTAADILASNKTWNVFNSLAEGKNAYQETINGVEYNTYVLLYNKALEPGETTLPSIYKVFLDARVDIDPEGNMAFVQGGNVTELDWNINEDGAPIIYAAAYAVQKEGFETVKDAYDAYSAQWGNNGSALSSESVTVKNDDELAEALKANAPQIYVKLQNDASIDVAAWKNNAMGGAATEEIIIDGDGQYTLTFNQTNSDWSNVVTNGAKLVLKNMTIDNSGYNDGPWNRHDINFGCEVDMINVESMKAIALKQGASLKNVTIADDNNSDTYAIWIQPNGQTVTLDNCVIDMLAATDGRGIKIDEQYVSEPEKVTLSVKNTTFKTEEKSAILVKSAAGADITLSDVNIDDVAADSENPVWVDSASTAYADLVVVTGGTKVNE